MVSLPTQTINYPSAGYSQPWNKPTQTLATIQPYVMTPLAQAKPSISSTEPAVASNPIAAHTSKQQVPKYNSTHVPPHSHSKPHLSKAERFEQLAMAGLMIGTGFLLHRLPKHNAAEFALISVDWKDWTRVGLGIWAVNKINKATNFEPPAWLQALETAAIIHPMAVGITQSSLGQFALIAPLVTGVVQANVLIGNAYTAIKERITGVPTELDHGKPKDTWDSMLFKIATSLVFAGISLKVYPKLYEVFGKTGILGSAIKKEATDIGKEGLGAAVVTCARGCCIGVPLCLTELGEIFGGLIGTFKHTGSSTPARFSQPTLSKPSGGNTNA